MNDLEKHIKENRLLFDEHKADKAKMWQQIENGLATKPKKSFNVFSSPFMKVAASIFMLLGVYTVINFILNYSTKSDAEVVDYELQAIDMHYSKLVEHQIRLVKENKKLSQEEKDEFLSFMVDLDEEYKVLKIEMEKNLDNEQIIEAIVNNYKKKIELMENLLDRINNSKNIDNENGYIL